MQEAFDEPLLVEPHEEVLAAQVVGVDAGIDQGAIERDVVVDERIVDLGERREDQQPAGRRRWIGQDLHAAATCTQWFA